MKAGQRLPRVRVEPQNLLDRGGISVIIIHQEMSIYGHIKNEMIRLPTQFDVLGFLCIPVSRISTALEGWRFLSSFCEF